MRGKSFLAILIALLLTVAVGGLALAHEPEVTVTPEQLQPGGMATIAGHEFTPNSTVTITSDDLEDPLATVQTDAEGHFAAEVMLPQEMPAGTHALMVMDNDGKMSEVALTVMAAAGVAPAAGMAPPAGVTSEEFNEKLIATIPSTYESAEIFIEGTIAAALPVVLLLILALHLARPYMLNVVQKFSLRLGADLWWLIYVGARDLLVVVGFLLSTIFLMPHVLEMTDLPITGSVAAAILFAVLLIKLLRDVDEDRVALILVSNLLVLASAVYLVAFWGGVMVQDLGAGGLAGDISDALVTTTNLTAAKYVAYGSLAAIVAMGGYALFYNLRVASRRAEIA